MSTELDALMLANALEVSDKHPELINVNNRAAAKLRRLHAEVERKSDAIQRLWKERDELRAVNESDTALLRQALEALEKMLDDAKHECVTVTHWNDCVDTITALRERLGEKT